MKANELMIGDWVRSNNQLYQVSPYLMIEAENGKCTIEPIPLTKEILEKNCFIKSNVFVEWKYEDEGLYILWKPFPFLKVETESVQLNLSGCEYIHELQHVLRLCGIDKEIVL